MQPTDFVHLHVHSDFSLLDGNCRVDNLVNRVAELEMNAVGLTDHGNLFGAVHFYKEALRKGIKPILGMEGYLAHGSRLSKERARTGKSTFHMTLLARNEIGFRNLIKLSSKAYLEGFYYKPRADKELLAECAEGLTCLSGCLSGELIQALRHGGEDAAGRVIDEYREIFGADNYFVELMDNGIELQNKCNKALIPIARSTGAHLVATNDVHYITAEDREAQDVMLCIGTGKLKTDTTRFRLDSETLYLRSGEEMMRIFSHVPEACENTRRIADSCDIKLDFNQRLLPNFDPPDGMESREFFGKLCQEGVERLYPNAGPEVMERLEYESKVITEMGFVDYFLIVWDFIRYARENDIPVGPGRGSSAGSIVAYLMGITRVDPLAYDLLFERFLNAERISMPDIDIDFCKDGRERVIEYVSQKYGKDRVAQIITFGTMAAKGAIRDVGRVLDVPLSEVDAIAKKIPVGPNITLQGSLDKDQELREVQEENGELFDVALRLEGSARHCSVHAAGVVITDRPLIERVPLYKNGDTVTTQWSMDVCEDIGLLKMDFLGLRTLTIIDKTLKLIERSGGGTIDINALPLDDPATYKLLQNADTAGVFQLESDGMKELLEKLKADSFDDVIAVLALYRPGPLGSGMAEMYWKRKHGLEKVTYAHPALEEILAESNGVILYQEQVMRIAAQLANFSLNEADFLRKAMGKKKPAILKKLKEKFVEGTMTNDVSHDIATEIWEQIEHFAGYGFNKSHSTAYAIVTYQTAWLKTNHPLEFMAALLTCEMANTDKTIEYIEESRKMGIEILPPDVGSSCFEFAVEGKSIRYALGAIKGTGQKSIDLMSGERESSQKPFLNIYDFCERVDGLNKGVLEALILAGAFDSLDGNRAQQLAVLEDALRVGQGVQEDRRTGQMSLFGEEELQLHNEETGSSMLFPDIPELKDSERLRREKEVLGFYLSGHPLSEYRDDLMQFTSHTIENLHKVPDKSIVRVGGIIRSVRLMLTRRGRDKGKRMAFLKFEDFTGAADCVVFASVYGPNAELLKEDQILFIRGEVDKTRKEPNIKVNEVIPLETAKESLIERLTLKVPQSDDLDTRIESLKKLLKEHPGRVPVSFVVAAGEYGSVTIRAGNEFNVAPVPPLIHELKTVLGSSAVRYN